MMHVNLHTSPPIVLVVSNRAKKNGSQLTTLGSDLEVRAQRNPEQM